MQNYKEKPKEQSVGKRIILEFLDFLRFKIENDSLTLDEMDSIAQTIQENLVLYGTTEDFARYYRKSKDSVKVNISRKMFGRPIRKVLYSFTQFRKIIPPSWKLHSND